MYFMELWANKLFEGFLGDSRVPGNAGGGGGGVTPANFLFQEFWPDWLAKPENWGLVGILLNYLGPPLLSPPLLSANHHWFRISLKTLN